MAQVEQMMVSKMVADNGTRENDLKNETGISNRTFYRERSVSDIPATRSPEKVYQVVKRCFDFLSSLLVSIVLLPLVLILMALIMIKDPGNPLYFQKRVGKGGHTIYVAKLRTMRRNADHLEEMLTPEQIEEFKREYKLRDDPRLIGWNKPGDCEKCFGAFLRKLSLDELPQIAYNICLKGNMSVVGPRPIVESELNENYTPEEQKLLLSVKPGLTGYWQAYARNEAKYEDGRRQQMELWYVQNRSLWLDVKIIFASVVAVIKRSGV